MTEDLDDIDVDALEAQYRTSNLKYYNDTLEIISRKCAFCQKERDGQGAPSRCARCKYTRYCDAACQSNDWVVHKPKCNKHLIKAVQVCCLGDPEGEPKGIGAWKEVLLDTKQHPAFAHLPHNKAGIKNMGQEVSSAPIFEKLGFPIMIWRHEPRNWLQRPPSIDTSLDNQKATFLMIDPVSGLAPDEWQQAVGTVTVFRPDGKTDLNVLEFETVWMYADHLIDRFGEDPEVAHSCINRSYFDRWCQNYKREAIENLNPQFKELKLPL